MASLDVEVDVDSTSCTLSDDSTSTMGTAMSIVAARDDEAIADDEAAADDEATVIAESVGVRDEAVVSGELLILSLGGCSSGRSVLLLGVAEEDVQRVVVSEVPLEEVGSPKSVEDAPLEAESPKCAGVEGPAPDC